MPGGGGLQVMDATTYSKCSFALILRYLLDYVAVCSMQRNTTTALLQVKSWLKLQLPSAYVTCSFQVTCITHV